jgi:alpha-L-fucosidase
MKKQSIACLLSLVFIFCGCTQTKNEDKVPLAPEQNRRPENYQLTSYKYSLNDLKNNFSEEIIQLASQRYETVKDINEKGKWKPTAESIDNHQAPEWFLDAKFGMFIDWGLWSVAGWAPQREKVALYPDWYEYWLYNDSSAIIYHEKNWGKDFKRDDFIPLFTAEQYQPQKLVDVAKEAGMKYIVPFCKHHSGFCLWPSTFTYRDAVDMGPKKDLIRPMVESCKEQGLKFGFYFSLEEWEYPLINDENNLVMRIWEGKPEPCSEEFEKKASGKIAVKNFTEDYIVPQATEFIDNYDPDILWFDGEWSTSVYDLQSYDITAYFYNKAEGRKEVAVNDRYGLGTDGKMLRFKRGDFFTSEYHDHEDQNKTHPWEECRGISRSFGYNWQDTEDNVISSEEFIKMFVEIVSHGGNLLLIVNLDGQGALPVVQEKRLKEIGQWLKVNGEGIYGTRAFTTALEGDVRYTSSKNGQIVYAISTLWPGEKLELKSVVPKSGSEIYLLGTKEPLRWYYDQTKGLTTVLILENLQKVSNRPCNYAYTFRMEI